MAEDKELQEEIKEEKAKEYDASQIQVLRRAGSGPETSRNVHWLNE